jgi:hypothetical protein
VHESVVTGCAAALTRCRTSAYALWYLFIFLVFLYVIVGFGYYHLCNLLEKAAFMKREPLSVLLVSNLNYYHIVVSSSKTTSK